TSCASNRMTTAISGAVHLLGPGHIIAKRSGSRYGIPMPGRDGGVTGSRIAGTRGRHAVALTPVEFSDLRLLAWDAYSPLDGFLREDDYVSSRDRMRLVSGPLWPLPISLGAGFGDSSRPTRGRPRRAARPGRPARGDFEGGRGLPRRP